MSQTEPNTRSDFAHARSETEYTRSHCELIKIAQNLRSHLPDPLDLSPDRLADFLVSMEACLPLLREMLGDTASFAMSDRISAQDDPTLPTQQRIVNTLGSFFQTEFPDVYKQHGIVYTPLEIVDFILHSVNDVLQKEFGRSLSDEDVDVYDLFAGCGTFLARMYELGLASPRDGIRGCEIDLFAYFVSLWNLRSTTGIFDHNVTFGDAFLQHFPEAESKIRVFIGNPPYSTGRKSTGGSHPSQKYPELTRRIYETYMQDSRAQSKSMLADSYVRAMRLVSDLIAASRRGGIVGFVVNGSWVYSRSFDGFRKHLAKDFSSIYVFNLRGNQRTSGELLKKEGERIFPGVRVSPAITLLVRKPGWDEGKATIYYHDIGDYLSRKEKFEKIKSFGSVGNPEMEWDVLGVMEDGWWLSRPVPEYASFTPLFPQSGESMSVFTRRVGGVATGADGLWWSFSRSELERNVRKALEAPVYDADAVRVGMYRPFVLQYLYDDPLCRRIMTTSAFPSPSAQNLAICVAVDANDVMGCLLVDTPADSGMTGTPAYGCMRLYSPEEGVWHDGISDEFLWAAREKYRNTLVTKEDIFFYVYGLLHSKEYRSRYAEEFRRAPPRIPLVSSEADFLAYIQAGRDLAKLHLEYEKAEPYAGVTVDIRDPEELGNVSKLSYVHTYTRDATGKPTRHTDTSVIRFFAPKHKTRPVAVVSGIPARAYEYIVGVAPAVDHIVYRYSQRPNKRFGGMTCPSAWGNEHGNPRYILDLLLSVITVSMKTMEIVENLPRFEFGG